MSGILLRVTLSTLLLIAMSHAQVAMCGSAQHADWSKQFIDNNKYYLGNFPYGEAGGWHCITGNNHNDWAVAYDVPGGAYWCCIVVGQWPWGAEKTVGSPFPMQVSDPQTVSSSWTFTVNSTAETNCPWEIWIHNSPTFDPANPNPTITCDLMIEPNYGGGHGTYTTTVTIDGVEWDVYMQGYNGAPGATLPHYQRKQKTMNTGTVTLSSFWKDAANRGWCGKNDWVSSVTCGFEFFGGSGQCRTTAWDCWAGTGGGCTAPAITTQPANKTVAAGRTATFSVLASGSALSYQWKKNGANINGATSSSYTTPAVTSGDNNATFSCYISNTCGNVTSAAATLTVGAATGGDVLVRAHLIAGTTDKLTLRLDNADAQTWDLATAWDDYAISGLSGTKNVKVFFGDVSGSADAEVDYITINGATTMQAEDQTVNTAVWYNGACGGGSKSQLMHCAGYIDFGNVNFGNPVTSVAPQNRHCSIAQECGTYLRVTDMAGRLVFSGPVADRADRVTQLKQRLPKGAYEARITGTAETQRRILFIAGE